MAQTTTTRSAFEQAGHRAEQAARDAVRNPWVEKLARFGLAARGVVYAVIGLLAVQTAFLGRGQVTGTQGAIQKIAEQSRLLLALVAIGLLGYALWRLVQGLMDPERRGRDPKGLAVRGGQTASGLVYAGLAVTAFRIVAGSGGSDAGAAGGQGGNQALAAGLLDKPFGRWLVILAGVAILCSGFSQLWQAYTKKFQRKLKMNEMDETERRLAVRTGQAGLASRGLVFLIMGWFLIQAALRYDPSQARGLPGALEALAGQPYGPWLLGIVALGLTCFGAYSFLQARYRRIVL
jgi:Domain of Unknown Function (DUF1206)